ncbi:MAG: TolC family protein [Candidatus Neomarinimicrobiota bacterium]|nr:MAG: TolC family protein [Candidatus Neomarinimicrobiota bacterium]
MKTIRGISLFIIGLTGTGFAQTLTLEDCIREALQNRETVVSARLDETAARLGKKGSFSAIYPSLSLSGGWQENRFPERQFALDPVTGEPIGGLGGTQVTSVTSISSGLSGSGTLYDGGRWWNTIQQASNSVEIARERLRQARINVIRSAAEAYYNQLKAEQLMTVAEKNLDLANRQVELAQQQYQLGAVKRTDLLKAEVQQGQARMELLNRQVALAAARRDLLNALGRNPSDPPLTLSEGENPLGAVPDWNLALANLEEHNPALQAAKSTVRDARLSYKLARGLRLPSLNYRLSYGASSDALQNLGSAYQDNWSLSGSLSLSFPLFTGFELSTREQQAKINVQQRELDVTTTRKDLVAQLGAALDALRNYHEILPIAQSVLESAEEDLKLAEQRYQLGAASILELLDAQVSVVQARSNYITTYYDTRIQEARVEALMGTLDAVYTEQRK